MATKKSKTRRERIGAVRAVPKPKGRKEALKWAENLGFEALCNVRGGVKGKLAGASATHGGSYQMTGCCPWDSMSKPGWLLQMLGKPGPKGIQPLTPKGPTKLG